MRKENRRETEQEERGVREKRQRGGGRLKRKCSKRKRLRGGRGDKEEKNRNRSGNKRNGRKLEKLQDYEVKKIKNWQVGGLLASLPPTLFSSHLSVCVCVCLLAFCSLLICLTVRLSVYPLVRPFE